MSKSHIKKLDWEIAAVGDGTGWAQPTSVSATFTGSDVEFGFLSQEFRKKKIPFSTEDLGDGKKKITVNRGLPNFNEHFPEILGDQSRITRIDPLGR